MPRLHRLDIAARPEIAFEFDGQPLVARAGDTVLTAILTHRDDFPPAPGSGPALRAGFCLMGACQECWVWIAPGKRVRACGTRVAPGMKIRSVADA